MNKLCCISLSLAARIVGAYSMSISILLINVLMSSYFSRESDDEFFDTVENWALLGLNWVQLVRASTINRKIQTAVLCFLVYTVSFLAVSAYLALASISRKPKYAVPWMYLQLISIIDQSVALSIHLTHGQRHDVYDRSVWYVPVSSVYLLLCVYLWMIVQAAGKEWSSEQTSGCENIDLRTTASSSQTNNGNEPKSPSFLSQNFSIFDSPRPPILPK